MHITPPGRESGRQRRDFDGARWLLSVVVRRPSCIGRGAGTDVVSVLPLVFTGRVMPMYDGFRVCRGWLCLPALTFAYSLLGLWGICPRAGILQGVGWVWPI